MPEDLRFEVFKQKKSMDIEFTKKKRLNDWLMQKYDCHFKNTFFDSWSLYFIILLYGMYFAFQTLQCFQTVILK